VLFSIFVKVFMILAIKNTPCHFIWAWDILFTLT